MFLILTLGALSVVLALILTPLVRDHVGKLGFLDHPDGVRKKHAGPVPRVGGIAIVISYIIPSRLPWLCHSLIPSICIARFPRFYRLLWWDR